MGPVAHGVRSLPLLAFGVGVGLVLAAATAGLGLVPLDGWPILTAAGAGIAVAAALFVGRGRRDGSSPVDHQAGWLQFRRELIRARRRERALTLIRVPLGVDGNDDIRSVVDQVRRELRRDDTVWADGTDVYLVLPETDRGPAEAAVGRLRDLGVDTVSVATFPGDGLTSGALLAAVGGHAPKVVPVRDASNSLADPSRDEADRQSASRA